MPNLELITVITSLTKSFAVDGSFPPAVSLLNTRQCGRSHAPRKRVSQWIYTLLTNFSSSQRPIPTHQSDELVLELGVQAGDHHLHGVADLPHALVLGAAHGLHVPLLNAAGGTRTKAFTHPHLPLIHTLTPLSQIPEMLKSPKTPHEEKQERWF